MENSLRKVVQKINAKYLRIAGSTLAGGAVALYFTGYGTKYDIIILGLLSFILFIYAFGITEEDKVIK